MGWTSAATITSYVIIEGDNDGIFIYNGKAGAGTLIESAVAPAAAGIDPYGNSYLGGHTLYGHTASEIVASQWTSTSTGFPMLATFTGPTSGAGPWTAAGSFVFNGANEWGFLDQSGNTLLTIQEAQLIAGPHLKSTEPGTNNVEIWHALPLAAGWSAVSGFHTPAYRINALGNVELTGRVTGTTGTDVATLPVGYYSVSAAMNYAVSVPSASAAVNTGQSPRASLSTSGAITIAGYGSGVTVTVDLDGTFMLSAG